MVKQTFKLKGLECASCTSKIERDINKIKDIKSARLSFLTSKLTVEYDGNDSDNILEMVSEIINKYEPDVVVCSR